jgi:hypothetical protein
MMRNLSAQRKAWRAPKLHVLEVKAAETGGVKTGDGGTNKKS